MLKLLRAGAHVIATTRFPSDAAQRYAREPDFGTWCERLEVVGPLELANVRQVEALSASECLGVSLSASECLGVPRSAPECLGVPRSASECLGVPLSASECLGVPRSAPECL